MEGAGHEPQSARRREMLQAVWLALGVWATAGVFFAAPAVPGAGHLPPVLALSNSVCALAGAALSSLLGLVIQAARLGSGLRRTCLGVVGVLLCAGLLVTMDRVLVTPIADAAYPGEVHSLVGSSVVALMEDYFTYVWIFGFHATVVVLLEANRLAEARRRRLFEADAAAKSAQLTALRFQINPHFLFNTLNAVSSLVITGRVRQAEQMIDRLSDFLRSTLSSEWSDEIPLAMELDALEAYLEIEAVRFGDRFTYAIDISPESLEAMTPSLILQPLAENTIKHAVAPTQAPVQLTITAGRQSDNLVLRLSDNGCAPAGGGADSVGVGLKNVAERIRTLYGAEGSLECRGRCDGFDSVLTLPFVAAAKTSRAPHRSLAEMTQV